MPGDSDAGTLPLEGESTASRARGWGGGWPPDVSFRMTSWRKAPRVTEGGPCLSRWPWGAAWSAVVSLQCVLPPRALCGRCWTEDGVVCSRMEPAGESGPRAHEDSHLPGQGRPRPRGQAGPSRGGGWVSVPRQWWAAGRRDSVLV